MALRMTFRLVTIVLLISGLSSSAATQAWNILAPEVVGLRVSGPMAAGVPVVTPGQQIRFALDAMSEQPWDLRVEVVHCDKDWIRTASEFVNDPAFVRGRKPIPSTPAAAGIRSYRWTYAASVPAGAGLEPARFSGNYVATIVDERSGRRVADFRFSVAERVLPSSISVRKRRIPMRISPWDEAHQVTVRVDEHRLADDPGNLFLQSVRVVDIYKNREWDGPYRIDMNDLTPSTWVDGVGTSSVSFTAGEVMPGNEYRILDIRSIEQYPASHVLRARDGADVSRFFSASTADNNGASVIVDTREYADYERFEFQVWWESDNSDGPLYVLGDFNGWKRSPHWILQERDEDGRFALTALLKRGRYDFQYSVGNDPLPFEGNSWDTTNLYTALTYYGDQRLGGYDRILFVAQAESSGGKPVQEGRRR